MMTHVTKDASNVGIVLDDSSGTSQKTLLVRTSDLDLKYLPVPGCSTPHASSQPANTYAEWSLNLGALSHGLCLGCPKGAVLACNATYNLTHACTLGTATCVGDCKRSPGTQYSLPGAQPLLVPCRPPCQTHGCGPGGAYDQQGWSPS